MSGTPACSVDRSAIDACRTDPGYRCAMDTAAALQDLRTRLAEIADLSRAAGVLGWEQRVSMPPLGTEARANQLATLSRIAHERFTDAEVGRLLERLAPLEESLPHDSDDASLVRVTRRDWEKQRRVPAELEEEMTRAAASGHHAWIAARRERDFDAFLPYLERNVELRRRYVDCFEWSDSPYTPLLDDYEPGMLTSEVRDVFAILRPALTELVKRAPAIDASFLGGHFDPAAQRAFAEALLPRLGFADGGWRLDPTAHPFCTSFSNRDVRLTTRYHEENLESIWSTLHEAGHGLYAAGIADSLQRSPLGGAPSLGINESQSRTWENLVGRSRAFWTHWYEPLQATFPSLATVPFDDFVRAINRAEPGLIRVDADETTYSLHIILRFELEQEMLDGTVALADLPEAWAARMKEFLGLDVPHVGDGVLQDVHWSSGHLGYFPTYALGNVISLQLWHVVREALPDLDAQLAAGELLPLSDWLRDHLYSLGRKLTPKETLGRLTGSPSIDPAPYLAYLSAKVDGLAA
jgi:carboxypeptidase Taq